MNKNDKNKELFQIGKVNIKITPDAWKGVDEGDTNILVQYPTGHDELIKAFGSTFTFENKDKDGNVLIDKKTGKSRLITNVKFRDPVNNKEYIRW